MRPHQSSGLKMHGRNLLPAVSGLIGFLFCQIFPIRASKLESRSVRSQDKTAWMVCRGMLSPSSLKSWGGGPSPCEGLPKTKTDSVAQTQTFGQRQRGNHLCKSRSGGVGHSKDAAETPPTGHRVRRHICASAGDSRCARKFDLAAAQKRRSNQAAMHARLLSQLVQDVFRFSHRVAQDDDALLLIRKIPVAPPHDGIRGHQHRGGLQPGTCRRFQSFSIRQLGFALVC